MPPTQVHAHTKKSKQVNTQSQTTVKKKVKGKMPPTQDDA